MGVMSLHLPTASHDTRYRYRDSVWLGSVSQFLNVYCKSHVITRGHWLSCTIGWCHLEGQSDWRRVDLSGSWISREAAIFYVTRDVITGL